MTNDTMPKRADMYGRRRTRDGYTLVTHIARYDRGVGSEAHRAYSLTDPSGNRVPLPICFRFRDAMRVIRAHRAALASAESLPSGGAR